MGGRHCNQHGIFQACFLIVENMIPELSRSSSPTFNDWLGHRHAILSTTESVGRLLFDVGCRLSEKRVQSSEIPPGIFFLKKLPPKTIPTLCEMVQNYVWYNSMGQHGKMQKTITVLNSATPCASKSKSLLGCCLRDSQLVRFFRWHVWNTYRDADNKYSPDS